jgi:Ca2+/Na+ antiporter
MGLAVLLHVSLTLLFLIRKKKLMMTVSAVLAVGYIGGLIYFNI